jgi:phenylalanyl-tRNA synthetase beta chain
MVLDQQVRYQDIEKLAFATIPDLLKEVNLFDVYEGEKIGAGKKSYAMSFLLRDEEQTLQDQRIDKVMEKLMKQLEEKLGVMIRKG